MPLAVEKAREIAALRQVHHERVAVDVVAGVLVVGPRHRTAFDHGPFVLVVPVHDQPVAIGVQHRDDDHDEMLQLGQRRLVGRRGQRVEKLSRRLCRADFRCVNTRADGDDGRLGGRQPPRFVVRDAARIGESLIRRANLFEVADIFRRGDDCCDRAVAVRGGAEINDLDAIGGGRDCLEILLDVVGGRELSVAAEAEPEPRFRIGKASRLLSRGDARQQGYREEDGACAHAPS